MKLISTSICSLALFLGMESLSSTEPSNKNKEKMTANKIKVTIGTETFTSTLLNNASAKAFLERLPIKINMSELNGNEKYYRFSKDLPTEPSNPGTIRAGDIMLFGANTLVVFYETFPSSFNYTKLGSIDNPGKLKKTLGSGNITVVFEKNSRHQ